DTFGQAAVFRRLQQLRHGRGPDLAERATDTSLVGGWLAKESSQSRHRGTSSGAEPSESGNGRVSSGGIIIVEHGDQERNRFTGRPSQLDEPHQTRVPNLLIRIAQCRVD